MFPLKTMVLAVIIAIVFGPHVNACPAHNHLQTATPKTATPAQVSVAAPAVTDVTKLEASKAQRAEVAVADQPSPPAAN